MLVVGLTGSIAMGKSETSRMFERLGVPVFDADRAVHALYAPGGAAVAGVEALFPGTVREGAVDRVALAARVLEDPAALKRLEGLVHPLVRRAQEQFIASARAEGRAIAVLDIPLLFEGRRQAEFDRVVVASAPADVQRARALARPGMTEEKLAAILARQMPDDEKRARAHFVVDTGRGLDHAFEQVSAIVATLRAEADSAP